MGAQELAIVGGVVLLLLLLVPSRFPGMARSITDGIREFHRIGKDDDGEAH